MLRVTLLIVCLLAGETSGMKSLQGSPEPSQSLWTKLEQGAAEHQMFTVDGRKYEVHRMQVANPDDSRYGLVVVWGTLPAATYELSVVDIRRDGSVLSTFEAVAHPHTDILLMNGGFFGQKDAAHYMPMGLLVADGVRISKIWPWTTGGVLVAPSAKSPVQIVPIKDFRTVDKSYQAIQSKPLLVEDSKLGIRTDDHQHANRTAVAICSDGSLLFAGAFAEGGAVSLYEFAAILKSGKLSKSPVEYALNMDGGPGAHIYIPALHLHFGSDTVTYVPDLIRLSGTRR